MAYDARRAARMLRREEKPSDFPGASIVNARPRLRLGGSRHSAANMYAMSGITAASSVAVIGAS